VRSSGRSVGPAVGDARCTVCAGVSGSFGATVGAAVGDARCTVCAGVSGSFGATVGDTVGSFVELRAGLGHRCLLRLVATVRSHIWTTAY
jgi:hypothetical protein